MMSIFDQAANMLYSNETRKSFVKIYKRTEKSVSLSVFLAEIGNYFAEEGSVVLTMDNFRNDLSNVPDEGKDKSLGTIIFYLERWHKHNCHKSINKEPIRW